MTENGLRTHVGVIEGVLPEAEVQRLAGEQGDRCYMVDEHEFGGYLRVNGGDPIPVTAHGAQLVYQEPHEHVSIAVCNGCFAVFTNQELPLTNTAVTPLLFITRKTATAAGS